MPFNQLILLSCLLIFFAGDQASDVSETKIAEPAKEVAANIILQSKDGGQTWQDISNGLPALDERMGFYASESELYLSTKGVLYSSSSKLKTPLWQKENVPNPRSTAIVFNRSGVLAYSYDGHIYQKKPASYANSNQGWLPVYTSLKSTSQKRHEVAAIFETADGSVFLSTGKSLSKSTDQAKSWKVVQKVFVGNVIEAEGVLVATGQQGIMRSTDNGEHWEWVVSEGGVGIAVERIEGGFAAIAYNGQTKSRKIYLSFDTGKTWKAIDAGLVPSPLISSIKQVGKNLFVGHPDGIFRSSDMGKTWHRVHAGFGNEFQVMKLVSYNAAAPVEKVFNLYVSGNVLYAVAVAGGC